LALEMKEIRIKIPAHLYEALEEEAKIREIRPEELAYRLLEPQLMRVHELMTLIKLRGNTK